MQYLYDSLCTEASLCDLAKSDFQPSVLQDVTIEKEADISFVYISEQDSLRHSHDYDHELACSVHTNVGSFKQGQQSETVKASGNV
jgi:hypothetical protein